MEALRESIRPEQCSLGTRQLAAHRAPVPIGATLAIAARQIGGEGSRSEWYVAIREELGSDERRLVWEGMLSFAVVDQFRFERERIAARRPRPARTPQPALAGNR